MMPFNEIHIGDIFSNPIHRGYGKYSGCDFCVIEKNTDEKMIKIQAFSASGEPIRKPYWKKSTDRMFSESWRESSFTEMMPKNTPKRYPKPLQNSR